MHIFISIQTLERKYFGYFA